jgi:hypothetical protein
MASAGRIKCSLLRVTSPRMRTASPGPANGWRTTNAGRRPTPLPAMKGSEEFQRFVEGIARADYLSASTTLLTRSVMTSFA